MNQNNKQNGQEKFPEEGEVLLGTVLRIEKTNVFIKLDKYGKEGVMTFSEVSPGRIRNIRDFVVIGQKIVCKVLRINKEKDNIDLSLRRVTAREKREVLDIHKKEKDMLVMLGVVIKDKKKLDEIVEKIKERTELSSFLEEIMEKKQNSEEVISLLKKTGFDEQTANLFLKLVSEKIKDKIVRVKEKISLNNESENGLEVIKKLLKEVEEKAKVNYIGAPYFSIIVEDKNYKDANILVLKN